MAFGPLNLNHAQFWRSTPGELLELYEGFQWRDEHDWLKKSWQASQIMNSVGRSKKPANPLKMLNGIIRKHTKDRPAMTKAEQINELSKLKAEIDGKNND